MSGLYKGRGEHSVIDLEFLVESRGLTIQSLLAENQMLVSALEKIAETDVSDAAPDFLWLQRWRHNTKDLAREALKKAGRE